MFIKTKKIIVILFQKIANGNQTKDKFYLISYNLNERKYKLLMNICNIECEDMKNNFYLFIRNKKFYLISNY